MKNAKPSIARKQAGATMVEYALMVALIAVAVAGTVLLVGQEVNTKFDEVKECIANPSAENCQPTGE
ncbi:MAG TPA: Flp family type IVb pilin [Pseudomonadales bacterium]